MTERRVVSARTAGLFVGVGLLVALGAGGVIGVRLGERASRADARELRVVDPATLPAAARAESRSAGGFSGFGGPPALQGEVLRHGLTSEVQRTSVTLVDGAARTTIEYTTPQRLFRIAPASTLPAVGDTVVVNIEGARATSVLLTRLSAEPRGTPPR